MKFLNNRNDDDELLSVDDVDVQGQAEPASEPKSKGKSKANRLIADIMGGDIFTKDSFVNLFPFLFYFTKIKGGINKHGKTKTVST